MEPIPLIVIVGPTACGKTDLAIRIAKQYNGEVISADSRAIYKGVDIGAAKPSVDERQNVPHWGFDLVEPGERFTAADFQQYANCKIAEIRARGHVPILAGGTGLYVDAVIFNYNFPPEPPTSERAKWEGMDIGALHEYCVKNNIHIPENKHNKRYVVNAIFRNGYALKKSVVPDKNSIVVGIATERHALHDRITQRAEQIFQGGAVDEALRLARHYGWESEAMKANVYRVIHEYVKGVVSIEQAKELFINRDWQLAKRQMTWFRRGEHVMWLDIGSAYTYIAHALDKLNNL